MLAQAAEEEGIDEEAAARRLAEALGSDGEEEAGDEDAGARALSADQRAEKERAKELQKELRNVTKGMQKVIRDLGAAFASEINRAGDAEHGRLGLLKEMLNSFLTRHSYCKDPNARLGIAEASYNTLVGLQEMCQGQAGAQAAMSQLVSLKGAAEESTSVDGRDTGTSHRRSRRLRREQRAQPARGKGEAEQGLEDAEREEAEEEDEEDVPQQKGGVGAPNGRRATTMRQTQLTFSAPPTPTPGAAPRVADGTDANDGNDDDDDDDTGDAA